MKIKKELILREIGGDYVLVPVGKTMGEYTGLFPISETGAFIWKLLPEAIDSEDIVKKMYDEYLVDIEILRKDVTEFLSELSRYGIV